METLAVEYRILSLLRNRDMYLKYSPMVKENLFSAKSKYMYRLLTFYHKHAKGKILAPLSSLFALVNTRFKATDAEKYKEIIRKIKKYPLDDETVADDVVKTFVTQQIAKIMIADMLHSIDSGEKIDLNRIKTHLDQATLVESSDLLDEGYDYLAPAAQRIERDANQPRIATGLSPDIDQSIHGGLAAGELGVVVAPTKVGKTMVLINLSYNAMLKGNKVVYITLELKGERVASRFDQRVCRKPYEYIIMHPMVVAKEQKRLKHLGAGLHIKDSLSTRMSPNDLSIYLERLRKTFAFDLVVVDQADLMYTPKEYRERRYELSAIIIALRRLGAIFNVPVWTASQANRIAGAAGQTTIWDIAEDIGKVNWADVILTLSQSDEDKEEKIMMCSMGGNRIGEGNPNVMLGVNYGHMRVKALTDAERKEKE